MAPKGKRKLADANAAWDTLDLTGNEPAYYSSQGDASSNGRKQASISPRKASTAHTSYATNSSPPNSYPTPTSMQHMHYPMAASSSSMYPTPHYPAPLPSSSKPTQPTKKRQRKKDPANDEPPPEKRGAIMKKKCPKNILDRVDRVMSQRFFMLSRRRNPGELREEFGVLGSTGNVYTVTIGNFPSCSCPDASKGNHCKHILFIYLKVLQVPQESHVWYQKALLTSELDEIFSRATPAPNSAALADHHIQEAYARATGASSSQPSSSSGKDKGKPKRKELGPEDDCAVCYEAMGGKGSESLTWCDACGNALHSQCFAEWARSSRGSVTCVYCRVPWPNAPMKTEAKNAGDDNRSEGYLNLAGVAGISPVRDTSSYYHGYGHGRRYYGSIDDDFE